MLLPDISVYSRQYSMPHGWIAASSAAPSGSRPRAHQLVDVGLQRLAGARILGAIAQCRPRRAPGRDAGQRPAAGQHRHGCATAQPVFQLPACSADRAELSGAARRMICWIGCFLPRARSARVSGCVRPGSLPLRLVLSGLPACRQNVARQPLASMVPMACSHKSRPVDRP